MFYAVGYTNNGANEKRLGPFTTKDEAMKAGRSEAGITRGFLFSGVVDDIGEYVYHNSRACDSTNPVVANAMRASGGGVVAKNNSDDTLFDMVAMIKDLKRLVGWDNPQYRMTEFVNDGKHINNPDSWYRPNPRVPDSALASATQTFSGVAGRLGDAIATIQKSIPAFDAFIKAYKKVNNA